MPYEFETHGPGPGSALLVVVVVVGLLVLATVSIRCAARDMPLDHDIDYEKPVRVFTGFELDAIGWVPEWSLALNAAMLAIDNRTRLQELEARVAKCE